MVQPISLSYTLSLSHSRWLPLLVTFLRRRTRRGEREVKELTSLSFRLKMANSSLSLQCLFLCSPRHTHSLSLYRSVGLMITLRAHTDRQNFKRQIKQRSWVLCYKTLPKLVVKIVKIVLMLLTLSLLTELYLLPKSFLIICHQGEHFIVYPWSCLVTRNHWLAR